MISIALMLTLMPAQTKPTHLEVAPEFQVHLKSDGSLDMLFVSLGSKPNFYVDLKKNHLSGVLNSAGDLVLQQKTGRQSSSVVVGKLAGQYPQSMQLNGETTATISNPRSTSTRQRELIMLPGKTFPRRVSNKQDWTNMKLTVVTGKDAITLDLSTPGTLTPEEFKNMAKRIVPSDTCETFAGTSQ